MLWSVKTSPFLHSNRNVLVVRGGTGDKLHVQKLPPGLLPSPIICYICFTGDLTSELFLASHLNRGKIYFQFVSHPNVQQLLASIWYEGLPGFRRKNMALQSLEICRIGEHNNFSFFFSFFFINDNIICMLDVFWENILI